MSCSIASHSEPRWRSSAASSLSILSPSVSPGSKSFRRKSLPFETLNGSVYFRIASIMAWRAIALSPERSLNCHVANVRTQCQLCAAALVYCLAFRAGLNETPTFPPRRRDNLGLNV